VLHAVAGFTGRGRVKTATLVDAGGKLPLVLTFVDTAEHVDRVFPTVREMAGQRLIVRENVTIESGAIE
jgi:PII-like signaling protein